MKELKGGERVTITLEVVKRGGGCNGCFFNKDYCSAFDLGLNCILPDGKGVIFKEVKAQKKKMKENKHSLKISRSYGNITIDGYPIATYSNDELKILKNLLTKVLGEVNEYIKD